MSCEARAPSRPRRSAADGPRLARSGALALWIASSACPPDAPAGGSSEPATAVVEAGASVLTGDPLLAEARASLVGGRIAPPIRARLLASDGPAHARARRLLPVIDRASGARADGDEDEDEDEDERAGARGGANPGIAVPVVAPESDDGEGSNASSSPKPAAASPPGPSAAPPMPMLTRMSMSARRDRVTLQLTAGDRIVLGTAEQPERRVVRVVIDGAGALPAFLQARPRAEGVRVTDVTRGAESVIVAVELDAGWRLERSRSADRGGAVTFVRDPDAPVG